MTYVDAPRSFLFEEQPRQPKELPLIEASFGLIVKRFLGCPTARRWSGRAAALAWQGLDSCDVQADHGTAACSSPSQNQRAEIA